MTPRRSLVADPCNEEAALQRVANGLHMWLTRPLANPVIPRHVSPTLRPPASAARSRMAAQRTDRRMRAQVDILQA